MTRASAASLLVGLTLPNGWKVTKAFTRASASTGGTFSHAYIAEKGEKKAFLKALDFSEAFEPGVNTIAALQALTNAYSNERDILEHCKAKRLSRVVLALDSGSVQVPGMDAMRGTVHYLIFELANGDVRQQVQVTKRLELVWTMRALRDVSLGLWQLHREQIAHQDPKPSNVLIYDDEKFRIADLGRSSWKGRSVWYEGNDVAGDRGYAPPELLYGFTDPNFAVRRIGCDMYMFGNLVAFMFGGINVTANLLCKLDPQFHWKMWKGNYDDVLPYVQEAFSRVLEDLTKTVDPIVRDEVVPVIRQLCQPDSKQRGHPRGLGAHTQYSLERYVNLFDRLSRLVDIRSRTQIQAS